MTSPRKIEINKMSLFSNQVGNQPIDIKKFLEKLAFYENELSESEQEKNSQLLSLYQEAWQALIKSTTEKNEINPVTSATLCAADDLLKHLNHWLIKKITGIPTSVSYDEFTLLFSFMKAELSYYKGIYYSLKISPDERTATDCFTVAGDGGYLYGYFQKAMLQHSNVKKDDLLRKFDLYTKILENISQYDHNHWLKKINVQLKKPIQADLEFYIKKSTSTYDPEIIRCAIRIYFEFFQHKAIKQNLTPNTSLSFLNSKPQLELVSNKGKNFIVEKTPVKIPKILLFYSPMRVSPIFTHANFRSNSDKDGRSDQIYKL